MLANGTFMLAQACQSCTLTSGSLSTAFALFNASGLTWTAVPGQEKNDPNDEEGWTLEPSGQLLTVDTWLTPTTELFTPSSLTWSPAGNTVTSPVNSPEVEIGPQVEMPGGNTLAVGAGTSSESPPEACADPQARRDGPLRIRLAKWVKGPAIPTIEGLQYDSADGPGATLPDGNVLFDVSPCVYSSPLAFELYNATTRKLSPVADVPTPNTTRRTTRGCSICRTARCCSTTAATDGALHRGGTPNPEWAPVIASLSATTLRPGQTATLSGCQLAGLDQGAAYGDDVQHQTNFPLVRITSDVDGEVTYARTSNWSSASVAPGMSSSTEFTLPKTTPAGERPSTWSRTASPPAVPVTIR